MREKPLVFENLVGDIFLLNEVYTEKDLSLTTKNITDDIERLIFTLDKAYRDKKFLLGTQYRNFFKYNGNRAELDKF